MTNSKFIFFGKLVLVLLFLSMKITLFAQNQFIEAISEESLNLTKIQTSKLKKLEANPVYKNINFVRMGKIENFISNGELEINIPGQKESFIALVKEFDYYSETEYIWKGNIIDYYGNVVIFCQDGKIFGHIVIENHEFEIQTFENNTIFIEIDTEYVLKSKCGNYNDHEEEKEHEEVYEKIQDNKSNSGLVRILVLYTSNAQNAVSNISQTAILSVNQINDALDNSNITYSQLHVQRAKTKYLSFNENSSDIVGDVNRLKNNSVAQNYRNQYQADLVVLLTDGNYPGIAGIVADIGPNDSHAYAIVEADYATSNLTFAHEVAHLFGGRHQNDPNGTYEHGHYFTTGWLFWKKYHRTILGTYSNTYNRIQYYSNPDVEYKNKPTGTSASNDVAKKIRTTRYTVENFRPYNPPFNVYISGPVKATNSGTYTWRAIVTGGSASSYLWKYSYDGINYNGTFGTTQSITASMPYNRDLFLKLIATSTAGTQDIDYHVTINTNGHPLHERTETIIDTTNVLITKNSKSENISNKNNTAINGIEINPLVRIYPNPANTKTNFQYYIENDDEVIITITNIDGKLIDKFVENVNQGINNKEIDVSKYQNGVYFITVNTTKTSPNNYKLIINK